MTDIVYNTGVECSVNKYSNNLISRDYNTPRCDRAKLDTGTFCNYDCEFCYYQGLLHLKTNFEEIKNRIDKIYNYGISEIDLSGGESSVHNNWFDILDYCNARFKNISTLTNGWAFAKEEFLIKSKQHGLTEILFSLHGFDQQSHDTIVRRKGAWNKILKAIQLAHKHDIVVRINCTVYQRNHEGLKNYHNIIKQVKPLEVNFLTLNYWVNNQFAEPINYEQVTTSVKSCIDKIKHMVKYINVRYTPYCYMEGYEKYVCNQYQHIYDKYDWNLEIYNLNVDTTRKYSDHEKIDMAHNTAAKRRTEDYTKSPKCLTCKHLYICDGVENQVNNFIYKPQPGKKIKHINHYRKQFYE